MSASEPGRRGRNAYRPFAISVAPCEDGVEIAVAGELDLATAHGLEEQARLARASRATRIVLDLREVDFIDSTGLRVLLILRNDAVRNGHRLELVPPGPTVLRIFQITATRGLFDWRNAT